MDKRLALVTLAVAIVCPVSGIGQRADPPPQTVSLSDFFKPGIVFQDRNDDGVVDFVDARVVLAPSPSDAELAAAADVSARLGYETSAMNLPIAKSFERSADSGRRGSTPIFVGAKALAGSGATVESLGGASLKAGDGLVVSFIAAGRPAFALLGADESGLTAAAIMLGGHLPYVWDSKGPTLDKVADDLKQFLVSKGVRPGSTTASALFVRRGAPGIDRLVVDLQMADAGDVVKGQVALSQFKATSGRDPKRPLSYANVRAVVARLRSAGAAPVAIDLPRASTTAAATDDEIPPLPRRPAGGTKDNLDLSTFYSIEGALSDTDNNLIPDRVDVLLSAQGDGTAGVIDLAARLGLESTGVSIPIAKPAKAISSPDSEPVLVLIGSTHPLVDQLIKVHKWNPPSLQPGEGLIQLVKKAFGEKSALIVTGGDAAGVERAVVNWLNASRTSGSAARTAQRSTMWKTMCGSSSRVDRRPVRRR